MGGQRLKKQLLLYTTVKFSRYPGRWWKRGDASELKSIVCSKTENCLYVYLISVCYQCSHAYRWTRQHGLASSTTLTLITRSKVRGCLNITPSYEFRTFCSKQPPFFRVWFTVGVPVHPTGVGRGGGQVPLHTEKPFLYRPGFVYTRLFLCWIRRGTNKNCCWSL